MKATLLCLVFTITCGLYSSPPTLAQTVDTTSAWRYLPLQVGNVWEYERWEDVCAPKPEFPPFCEREPDGFLRRRVTGEATIDGATFSVIEEAFFSETGAATGTGEVLVRIDTTEARAYEHRPNGEEGYYWPEGFPCRLDMPFEGNGAECEGGYADVEAYEIAIAGEEFEAKAFVTAFGSYFFVADLGLVDVVLGKFITSGYNLTYARIGGVEYGTEQFPVAAESEPSQSALALSVFPNPSRGVSTVRFSLDAPQRVTLAVFDVLGRRVFAADLGAQPGGEATHRLDAAALPAGLYVVRLTGDAGASATTRIVRQ
jgi:hypothetical protein